MTSRASKWFVVLLLPGCLTLLACKESGPANSTPPTTTPPATTQSPLEATPEAPKPTEPATASATTTSTPAPPSASQSPKTSTYQGRTLRAERKPELPEHADGVTGVAFSADGRFIATVGKDLKLKICDARSGKPLHDITLAPVAKNSFGGPAVAIAFSSKKSLLAASIGKEIKLIDAESGKIESTLTQDKFGGYDQLRFTAAEDRLVTLSSRDVTVWSIADGSQRNTFKVEGFLSKEFALTPDGLTLAMEGPKGAIDLFDLNTGELRHRFPGVGDSTIKCVAINADGSLLAAGNTEERLAVYDLKTKAERFHVEKTYATKLAFAAGGLLGVGGHYNALYLVGDVGLTLVATCGTRGPSATGALAFSPDGTQLACTDQGYQHRADLFTLQWSQEEKTLAEGPAQVIAFAASSDGSRLAWIDRHSVTNTTVFQLTLYSVAEGKVVKTRKLDVRADQPQGLDFSPDGTSLAAILSKEYIPSARLYALPDLELKHESNVDFELKSLRIVPDGKSALLISPRDTFTWNVATGARAEKSLDFGGRQARFAPGDKGPLFVLDDDELHIYSFPDFKQERTWRTEYKTQNFALSADAGLVATYHPHFPRVRLWNGKTGESLGDIEAGDSEAEEKGIYAAAFSPDGGWLLTGGKNALLKVWSTKTRQLRASSAAHPGATEAIAFFNNGSEFVTSGRGMEAGTSIKQWNLSKLLESNPPPAAPPVKAEPPLTTGQLAHQFNNASDGAAGYLAGGNAIYHLGRGDKQLYVLDATSRKELWTLEVGDAEWVEFSPDGRWLAASYGDDVQALSKDNAVPATVKIWDAATRKLVHTLTLETAVPDQVCFSPDSKMLAVASGNIGIDVPDELSLWDVATGKRIRRLPAGNRRITHVRFSPDGSLVAYAGFGRDLKVWDVKADAEKCLIKLDRQVRNLKFSPDGKWIAACGGEYDHGTVGIYDAHDGTRQKPLADFNEEVVAFAFSPKGDLLVTASRNDRKEVSYRYWSLPDGKEVRRVIVESGGFGDVIEFSPDRNYVLTNALGSLALWRIDHLFDIPLQRMLAKLKSEQVQATYRGDLLEIGYGYDKTSDARLQKLPVIPVPFYLNVNDSNAVTDAGLKHLAQQTKLAGLDISGCDKVTPAGLAQLKALPLRMLNMTSFHRADEALLPLIGEFRLLEELYLPALSDDPNPTDLTPLAKLEQLRVLEFCSYSLRADALRPLASLPKVETFALKYAKLRDDDLKHLSQWKNLKSVTLHSSEEFTGTGLAHLAAATGLEVLVLERCEALTDAGFAAAKAFRKLRELNLENTTITDKGLAAVAEATEIEMIELPKEVHDAGLAQLANMTQIRKLDLHGNGKSITDAGLLHLAKLGRLETLQIGESPGITGSGFQALSGAHRLKRIHLSKLSGLTDEGLRSVAKMTQLTELDLPPQITEAGLKELAPLVNLTQLSLEGAKITDAGLAPLEKLPELWKLGLKGTLVTDSVVPNLIKLPKLSSVDLRETKMTKEGAAKLKTAVKNRYISVDGP